MPEAAPARRKLRKRLPSNASASAETASLRRTPSEPSRSVKSSFESSKKHSRSETQPIATPPIGSNPAAYTSHAGILEPEHHHYQPSATQQLHQRYSLRQKASTELLGQRFDSAAIIHNFDNILGQQQQEQQQPGPAAPHLLHQHSDITAARPTHPATARRNDIVANPEVRLSESLAATGRRMEDVSQARGPLGARNPAARLSDEAKESKMLKKKSGFSKFMNELVGSPRRPAISAPENPVHVTHVGYDQETGEFTVSTWRGVEITLLLQMAVL